VYESVEILENILTANLVYLCCKNPDLSVMLRVLSLINFFCEYSLQIAIFFLKKSEIFVNVLNFLSSCLVKMSFDCGFEVDESTLVILEFKISAVDGFLCIVDLISQLLDPLSQHSENRRVVNLELRGFDLLLSEETNPNWDLVTDKHLLLRFLELGKLLTVHRLLISLVIIFRFK
jgi:hypothetical protein